MYSSSDLRRVNHFGDNADEYSTVLLREWERDRERAFFLLAEWRDSRPGERGERSRCGANISPYRLCKGVRDDRDDRDDISILCLFEQLKKK